MTQRISPRISVTKLGEYMVAAPARRRRIVIDQKDPKTFITAMYDNALTTATNFLVTGGTNDQLIYDEIDRLNNAPVATEWQQQSNQSCAEALDSFLGIADDINQAISGMSASRGEPQPPKLFIGGTSISVRPDIILSSVDSSGNLVTVGALKLYFSKTFPLTDTSAAYVTTVIHQFISDQVSPRPVDYRKCIVVDVFGQNLFSAPRAFLRRRNDVEAACQEIAQRWPTI